MNRLPIRCLALAFLALGFVGSGSLEAAWSLRGGEVLSGSPVVFDAVAKEVGFRDPISERVTRVPTRTLSLRSKQRLLLSPVYLNSEAARELLTREKGRFALSVLAVVGAVGGVGFWFAARLLIGSGSPMLAAFSFVGTWVVLVIFLVCYTFLKVRLDGGLGIVLFGWAVAIGVTPLYISAIYHCSYVRGLLVLLGHAPAAAAILGLAMLGMETVSGPERADYWWNVRVFEPAGLIAPAPRTGL